jgi:hypothetical protein
MDIGMPLKKLNLLKGCMNGRDYQIAVYACCHRDAMHVWNRLGLA